MVMNGFDTDGDGGNNFYAVNGRAFYYAKYPIRVSRSQTVRIYLANLTEFDLINSFHLHGDFFRYYPTGSSDQFEYTDTVDALPGPARDHRDRLRQHRAASCSTRTSRSSPSSAGWASSRSWTDGGRLGPPSAGPALALAALGARPDPPARRGGLAVRLAGGSLVELLGRNPPPADAFDIRRVEFEPGEIRIKVRNPQPDA